MTAPRLEVDLDKIHHNARTLVELLADRGISVTGVTKATLGSPEIAGALLAAGVSALGDSRIENIEAMRRARVPASMTLIRSPMPSQAARVVAHADVSFNTELDVITMLSAAAQKAGGPTGSCSWSSLEISVKGIMPVISKTPCDRRFVFPKIAFLGYRHQPRLPQRRVARRQKHGRAVGARRQGRSKRDSA